MWLLPEDAPCIVLDVAELLRVCHEPNDLDPICRHLDRQDGERALAGTHNQRRLTIDSDQLPSHVFWQARQAAQVA